jgi:hypothetical protein
MVNYVGFFVDIANIISRRLEYAATARINVFCFFPPSVHSSQLSLSLAVAAIIVLMAWIEVRRASLPGE